MKKIIVFSLISFAAATAYYFFYNRQAEEVLTMKPGYYEQWLEMKTMGTGIIPAGLEQSWYNQSINLRRTTSAIEGVNEEGPYNVAGRIRALLIDEADANHYLAGGISGGLWASYDKGVSWKPLNDNEVTLNVSCISQSKSNPAVIYYGTGEGSGNSVGFAGSGVFKSIDTGRTFTKLPATDNDNFTTAWKIQVDPNNADVVYLGTDRKGFFRTTDGGTSWSKVFSTTQEVNDVDVLPDGKVFFTIKGGGIFYSLTGELGSFSAINASPLPTTSYARVELAYCRDSYQNIYAAYSSTDNGYNGFIKGVYKSTDTGKSWVAVTIPSSTFIDAGFTWYCKIMEVHPSNPDRIFLAATKPTYSIDGGFTWLAADNTHSDYHSVGINPHNDNEMLVGNDGGVHLYNWNSMNNATTLNNGINITQFYHGSYHPTKYHFVGGTQDNGTQFSLNSSSVFSNINGGDGAFTHIRQDAEDIIYVSSQNGNIKRLVVTSIVPSVKTDIKNELDADNNGTIDEGASFINPYWMNYNNGAQLFFVTKKGVWRSNNQGDNWTKVTGLRPSVYSVGISNDQDPTIYMGGNSVFSRLENAGTVSAGGNEVHLISRLDPLKSQFSSCIRVHPTDNSIVYVGLSNYNSASRLYAVIYANTDSSQIVSLGDNLPSNLPINSFDVDPANPDSVFVVGTDYGLYSTTDRGATWHKQPEIPNVSVNTVQIRKTDGKVFIYTHGRGMFTANLKNSKSASSINLNQPKVTIFPNPAQNYITLSGDVSESTIYTILDATGKRLKSAFLLEKRIDITMLPKGSYYLILREGQATQTHKWIKE